MGPDTAVAALHGVAERDDADQARALLADGADPDEAAANGMRPLHRAAMHDGAGVGALLLEAGADLEAGDEDGMRPLHLAAMAGAEGMVALLLQGGARHDVAARRRAPLHWAALYGREGSVRLLLAAGAERGAPDGSGSTPAQLAARKGHTATAQALAEPALAPGP